MWEELVERIWQTDPAARSRLEIMLCYPGFHALIIHGLAHWLWLRKMKLLARLVSHIGRGLTGIEIHPGAHIGRRVFIDHGMGVVIGETVVVGDDAIIYQGVTLGTGSAGRSGTKSRDKKRHPTLGKDVVVGSGANILGDIFIGDHSRIASGSIVLEDIPAHSVVAGIPAKVISGLNMAKDEKHKPLTEGELLTRLQTLEEQVKKLATQFSHEHS
jgi:serine O-acetyltransferase